MTLWTGHKVIMQHRSEDNFAGWHITLPGHPVEVARTERKHDFVLEDAKHFLARVVGIEHGEITALYNTKEEILGFMYSVKQIPMAFLMKVVPEVKKEAAA